MALDDVQLRRHGVDFRADHGTGFIHQIDRLVRQKAIGNVPVRKCCRGNQCAVGDLDAVEDFIALLKPAQDRNCVLNTRLIDHHGLEPALQSGVLLDILAILVKRCCADAMQFAAGEHGL